MNRTRADVVIVGGGLLGLSTAYALRGRRDVLVLEREVVGGARGGSHGPTRIFRLGYTDPRYVASAMKADELWRAVETHAAVQLLHPTPQLTFGAGAEAVHRALTSAGAPVARITAAEIEQRFPTFAGRGDAVLETTSAVIAADRALQALREHSGAELREHARVLHVSEHRVETDDGIIDAQAVVVCAGPWSRALVAGGLDTTTTLEHAAYVRVPDELPIFIDFTEPAVYGLPTPGTDRYKLAVHHGGPAIDPDDPFVASPAAVTALQHAIDRWLPGAELLEVDVCPYDNTVDEDFIVTRIDGVVVGAGTSGHAFKFGPLLGRRLAALVQNPTRRSR